jgi:hypothetical protein
MIIEAASARKQQDAEVTQEKADVMVSFRLPRKRVSARGQWLPMKREIRVLKGSTVASVVAVSMRPENVKLRNRLLETGVIVKQDGELQFARDYPFQNASAAASVVAGNCRNGFESWRDSKGRTLQQLGFKR